MGGGHVESDAGRMSHESDAWDVSHESDAWDVGRMTPDA